MLTAQVFAPVPFHPATAHMCLELCGIPGSLWHYQPWDQPWFHANLLHRLTVWFPPPEIARQAIYTALEAWAEAPLSTSAVFLVPRILTAKWQSLSRHIVEIKTLDPRILPVPWCGLPIPLVLLYLPTHVRACPLPHHRMDTSTPASVARWHQQQAAQMRGLPPSPVDEQ